MKERVKTFSQRLSLFVYFKIQLITIPSLPFFLFSNHFVVLDCCLYGKKVLPPMIVSPFILSLSLSLTLSFLPRNL